MLKQTTKVLLKNIRQIMRNDGVPYGYVSVTGSESHSNQYKVNTIKIKIVKAAEHKLDNGLMLWQYVDNFVKDLKNKYESYELKIQWVN